MIVIGKRLKSYCLTFRGFVTFEPGYRVTRNLYVCVCVFACVCARACKFEPAIKLVLRRD